MSRRLLARLALAPVLTLALVGAVTTATPATAEGDPSLGRVSVPDQQLLQGCNRYRAHYVIRVPGSQFTGYVQIYSPRGRKVTGNLIDTGDDTPRRGTVRFKICDNSVVPGRFKAVLKLIYQSAGEQRRGRSEPDYFRLRR